ncbi:DUF3164 family protein [Ruegeria sp.]|uniref:DUF3164 family protein n=2 Tax=Ruegeria sp. TaxID=1879320 RepID=UPI003AFFA1B8
MAQTNPHPDRGPEARIDQGCDPESEAGPVSLGLPPLNWIDAATVDIDGARYMRDAQGRLTPLEMVRPQDQLQDEMVRRVIHFAGDLSGQIGRFRSHCFDEIGGFDAILEAEYGGHSRRSVKGNRTYMSYDGTMKVQVQIADRIAFGPELQVARDLVEECLAEWAEGSRAEIRTIVSHAFQVDKEGEIARAGIYSLLRLDIADGRWRRAMEAIRDAMRVVGSKTYMRCYRRATPDAAWEPISIDLAKAG